MHKKYKEYKGLDLPNIAKEEMARWAKEDTFKRSISLREDGPRFVFYEGPPSANGKPGIHHVMARAIKDIFCRYKTLKGFQVKRKAGWDTHGLPVELGVEKELGITKEDIGIKISIEEYNSACRAAVMRYTDVWNDLTHKMGYWVDTDAPYITYENKYIESVWWLLGQLYQKDLMYKGYTIQPYSPKAGTGLSSHELNQPGTYRDVTDTTIVAQFPLDTDSNKKLRDIIGNAVQLEDELQLLAWTTTPWTLPSNTALAVGANIDYVVVNTFNKYAQKAVTVVLAEALVSKHFPVAANVPFEIVAKLKGRDLQGLRYQQLLPYCLPMDEPEKAFQVILGDFVTTEDGTGIVHIAPTFGADDARVAKEAGVPAMLVPDLNGNPIPLVDLQGRFVAQMGDLAGMYVKNEYYPDEEVPEKSVDVLIAIRLKEEHKAFNVAKYVHSYPHCWRTDKPVLYYPLDSWFIKTTAVKDRMSELNKTIKWKPESTGTGRFGKWLENVNDWNLSRSRYWGIPIPIWRTEEGDEAICITSVEELKSACAKSVGAGLMTQNPLEHFEVGNMTDKNYQAFDLHKNWVDKIILLSPSGKPMKRESDLIDVWFDSGSMPYAQWHYPFENKALVDNHEAYPADFIAEGVDQTRGWFYTLHAISTMVFDQVAYKNVISNGLVLDKNGQKMSKRLGNGVDPFETLEKYGPDATRWYMISNAQPWDNLKFDEEGIVEVQRKFFGTLYNTYGFFSLYANVDGFICGAEEVPIQERPEIDRWILSRLHSLIQEVTEAYDNYEPTKAARLIQEFVTDHLSNWYVRLCRRRFWKGEFGTDKKAAYQTLFVCLKYVAQLASPIAPFYMDRLYRDLMDIDIDGQKDASVHLSILPLAQTELIDQDLEARMHIAQKISSMVLSLRKKERIKVRQPLQKIMVPILNKEFERRLKAVEDLILSEVNVKEMEYLHDHGILVKQIKANFKTLGPRFGKSMKIVAAAISAMRQEDIATLEANGCFIIELAGQKEEIHLDEVEISSKDIPGWTVLSEHGITVALDVQISDGLREEGLARELINRIQNMRKDAGFELTDRISVKVAEAPQLEQAIAHNFDYICAEILAEKLEIVQNLTGGVDIDIEDGVTTSVLINKLN